MAITTRATKGSPLTHTEVDTNFTDLRDNKAGYVTGDGGAVTQSTSKSTGVTLSKKCGQITLNGAALAAGLTVSFTLTNTTVAATDIIVLNHVRRWHGWFLSAQCYRLLQVQPVSTSATSPVARYLKPSSSVLP